MKKKIARFVCAFCLLFLMAAHAQAEHKGGIVLVLSGGAMRGLAHIGVLQALEEKGIPIVGIVGTSMGSIIGGLAASGHSPEEILEVIETLDLGNLMSEQATPIFVPSGDSDARLNQIPWTYMDKKGNVTGPLGGLTGVKLLERFAQLASRVQIVHFDDLPIPFAAVATDLETGQKVVLRSGSLASAMRASMSIPILFEPWSIGGKLLVDGGLASNLPVFTAKEIFPGYPVVAVNVTSSPRSKEQLHSLLDVIDQTTTIFTAANVAIEKEAADVLITPDVRGVAMFDTRSARQIVENGRAVAMGHMPEIERLIAAAPAAPHHEKKPVPAVSDIRFEGVSAKMAGMLREKYSEWIGKTPSDVDVIRAGMELGKRSDIQAVDYYLEKENGGTVVVMKIQRKPEYEINVGGFTTNLHPYRWIYVNGVARNIINEGDLFRTTLKIGEQWGVEVSYLTDPDEDRSWEILLSGQSWEVAPQNARLRTWERYGAGVVKRFRFGAANAGFGFAAESVRELGEVTTAWGPYGFLTYSTMDSDTDPTKGTAIQAKIWWPDYDEVLYRLSFFQAAELSDKWRFYLRAGFAEGDEKTPGHAAYLGAAQELYSYAGRPVEAEFMAWWNIAFRRVYLKSWWGSLMGEIFGGMGYAWNDEGDRIRNLWETGISLSIPGKFLDARLMFLYNDENDFKIGFFIGTPMWGHFPLP